MLRGGPILPVLVFASLPALSAAQTPSTPTTDPPPYRETVVVTGTAAPTTVADLSRTVRVITREEISRLPARSVDELLRLVASVDARSRGPHGVQTDFSVRGAGFGQALVLVDGVRFNNVQSGHHNSDLPITLDQIDRIEVLLGPGSSLYGADAFGGTINIVTSRSASPRTARIAAGQHGLVETRAAAGWGDTIHQQVAFDVSRSGGFMDDRDYRTITVASRTWLGEHTVVGIGHVDKDFGANGFYGASPSYEWTNQSALTVRHDLASGPALRLALDGSFRAHRDHFRWDVHRPGFAENRHRTYATTAGVSGQWRASSATDVRFGGEVADERIRSSNLGDHGLRRGGGYVEVQQRVGPRATLSGGLRVDGYSTFGSSASPAAGASWWVRLDVRVRSSVGRAYRVPTFTERYYRDPAHQANAVLDPERAWTTDAALDWLAPSGWIVTAGAFTRHERDVIDWVKARPQDLWQTTNIHRVTTKGLEIGAKRMAANGTLVSVDYTRLDTDTARLDLLSKYTLDYAPHSLVAAGALPLPRRSGVGVRIDVRARTGRDVYTLLDLRLTHDVGSLRLFADLSNLLNARYEEVRGIAMPGRWCSAGVEVLRW